MNPIQRQVQRQIQTVMNNNANQNMQQVIVRNPRFGSRRKLRKSKSKRKTRRKSRKSRKSRSRRKSRKLRSRRGFGRRFGDIKDDIANLNERIVKALTTNYVGESNTKKIIDDLIRFGILEKSILGTISSTLIKWSPVSLIDAVIRQIDFVKYLNNYIKDKLINMKDDLKILVHSVILNLLLYPNTLYQIVLAENPGTNMSQNLINIIKIILEKLIAANAVGPEVTSLLGKIKDCRPLDPYCVIISTILTPTKKESITRFTKLEPVVEPKLAPLVETIMYNLEHHKSTAEIFYKQPPPNPIAARVFITWLTEKMKEAKTGFDNLEPTAFTGA
jgi:hypothetical protein